MSKNLHLAIVSCLLLLGNASCFDTATTLCATGIRCPVDQGCAANQPVCITGLCGNGLIDIGEVCDDGNVISGDDCSSDCLSVEVCGNGITDPAKGEECDDAGESKSCDTDCSFAACGDGTVNISNNEECDAAGESVVCDSDCTIALCGDGLPNRMAGEICDDGEETMSCDTDCTTAECGDGAVNRSNNEECDTAGESAICDSDCTIALCGDSLLNRMAGEICDDGGETVSCDTDCTPAECSDGTVNKARNEDCDDRGDSLDCDSDCTIRKCGDGYPNLIAGEICDGGGETETCDSDCTPAECGDGVVNGAAGEKCDTSFLTSECIPGICDRFSDCGDGILNELAEERCDDGDKAYGGNGCTADCQYTEGITCTPSSSPGELWHLGTPAAPTGLTLSMKTFVVTGNTGASPRKFLVKKPSGAQHLAIPLVTRYDPNDDHDYGWSITWANAGDYIEFTIETNHADNPSTHIAGSLLVFGFDGELSGFTGGRPTGYLGNENGVVLEPRVMDRRTKVTPLAYTTSYLTGGGDSLRWNITESETDGCTNTFDSDTNKDNAIRWHANSLLLAEPIRAQRKSFTVSNDNAQVINFTTNPNAEQIWIPIVSTYNKGGDTDFAFAVDCAKGSENLTCAAIAWDGDNGSRISGYVLLLESLSGF